MFILAHSDLQNGRQPDIDQDHTRAVPIRRGQEPERITNRSDRGGTGLDADVGSTCSDRLDARKVQIFPPMPGHLDEWRHALHSSPASQPVLHRLDNGLAHRLDRCSAAGNGVVPMAAARAWEWLTGALED